ncbi:hypothetical protein EST38_g12106 [Candolleomyces aberdarensis]|uniref:Uncharacterized protein n=1 Tax=Candolleomyces aberdarensis TaxID=2316362 RepID=A0A4Q2D3Y3_9AGAR|nr:hypothetical protein EST38_g12106 [Candolleomyces aberdarensis]
MGLSTGTLPALTHLTLDRFASISNLAGQLSNRGFPWHQLTHLCLRDGNQRAWMEVGSIDDFFRQVPNLVDLIIQPLVHPLRRKKSGVVLPILKTFSFSVEYGLGTPSRDAWRAALSFLETPNLSALNIGIASDIDAAIVWECVPPFLQSSQCALKQMTLVNLSQGLTDSILNYTPSLEHLFISPPLSDALADILPNTSHLPNLSSITLYLDALSPRLAPTVVALLESRLRSSEPPDPSQPDPSKKALQNLYIIYRAGRGDEQISSAFRQIWDDHSLKGGLVPLANFPAKEDLRGRTKALSELQALS